MSDINQNHLIILNPGTSQLSTSTFFCNLPLVVLKLQLSNTLVCGLSIHNTFGNRPLPATTLNTNTINHKTLLCLVTQATSLVRASRVGNTNNGRVLAVLPTPHPLQEPQSDRIASFSIAPTHTCKLPWIRDEPQGVVKV
ncbi:hypothetical protein CIPAW_03G118100 [Carya illinoinensis]|uniref:Uncharacterized protein n=1 Tax=Carya illinoinensis TaxID=32201 RepID=A0A8T1R1P8_CARIL|nr:hypothetical protein CIPAW_03G118100 [Carya illinoinensis]